MNHSRDSLQMKKQLHSIYATADDPDGIRTHVTAVKGRCLNRLTTGPFAGQLLAVTGSRCLTAARTVQRPKQGSNL